MDTINTIMELLKKKGIKQKELAKHLGINDHAITDWKSGKSNSYHSMLKEISSFLNVSTDFLLGNITDRKADKTILTPEELQVLEAYRNGKEMQEAVKKLLGITTQTVKKDKTAPSSHNEKEEIETEPPKISIQVYDQPSAAGIGNYLDEYTTYETLEFYEDEVPYNADFGIRIDGDSMTPDIPDGSIVWVKEQAAIDSGQIGIFILDGNALCKKLFINHEEKSAFLVSINENYKPIRITENNYIKTVGKVIGVHLD